MSGLTETVINIESVRIPEVRDSYGILSDLGHSIEFDGMLRPITVWSDGTLVSGARRLRTHFLLAGTPDGGQYHKIRAVFVDNIEDAAQQLTDDLAHGLLAVPMKPTELCRLWAVLRKLDEPAAVRRADAARRRGVELRRAALRGERSPGRSGYSTDYMLRVVAAPFGLSESSAARLNTIYRLAHSDDPRADQARMALKSIDEGNTSIWACYDSIVTKRSTPPPEPAPMQQPAAPVTPAPTPPPASAARQLAAWGRVLPQMQGLIAGLIELGDPADGLTWDQAGPVHAQMSAIRRDLEKMIKKMKESAK